MGDDGDYCRWGPPEESTRAHERYIYKRLPTSRHVRLLLIYPRHPDASIRCSLIPVSLEQPPYFEAVSYTWGRPDKDFNVIIDDCEVPVTANAYNLLRDLSSYLLPRLLWIDSICIDQDNSSEKTAQVKLMGQIYSRASFVAVWLGSSDTQDLDFHRGEEISGQLSNQRRVFSR
ncbi:hypothetical protein NA56DRAFT_586193 [Hyaloscypha hepaticicola]|uniref:Heterokaryon incompatibility domain-containing protein n=1 Tax=Hyaloscypha hepaticicola TaxID=2082293 RepID=A0A2J6PGF6_9HELO|nr:hypothetical protein NA56DRAFT_586193 [Hyaloscypha hepaticicola]